MNLYEKLNKIQTELKAPKGQFNAFGKYKYRSCEDILESVKPLLNDCVILVGDEILQIGERYYVKATAALTDGEQSISISAFAREEESKKGMDASQVTGATSSYARKYALSGLLAIDDTKDSDYTNKHGKEKVEDEPDFSEMAQEQISQSQANVLHELIRQFGADEKKLCQYYKVAAVEAMTNEQYSTALVELKKKYSKDK